MTEQQALHNFFNSFGLNGYALSAVPDEVELPYLTYETTYDLPFTEAVSITVSLWYHTSSEAIPNVKVREIANTIGRGGVQIPHDTGTIWITCGSPFCIPTSDGEDMELKLRQLNLDIRYQ